MPSPAHDQNTIELLPFRFMDRHHLNPVGIIDSIEDEVLS